MWWTSSRTSGSPGPERPSSGLSGASASLIRSSLASRSQARVASASLTRHPVSARVCARVWTAGVDQAERCSRSRDRDRARAAHDSGERANTSRRVHKGQRIHARRSRRRSRCALHRPGRGGPPLRANKRSQALVIHRPPAVGHAGGGGCGWWVPRVGARGWSGPGRRKVSPAERIGVGLGRRPGELPGSAANPTVEHTPPARPGAPVALPGRHSCVQLSGISAPRRYRSR